MNSTIHAAVVFSLAIFTCQVHAANKPNILFIAIDDLRPELGCYGSKIAVSPNLDRLANDGLLFNRAYCQQAICRPSRASLMTGARPDTTGLFHNYVALRDLQPDIITLPQHFISHGYETAYCGKIFHQGDTDDEKSWSREPIKWLKGIKRPAGPYALAKNNKLKRDNWKRMQAKYGDAAKRGLASGPAYENADVPDHAYGDGYETLRAIATMKKMVKNEDQPFFLALGFKKPHLNWTAPKRYWDLYDPNEIPMASETESPQDGAAMGLHASFELRTRAGIPKTGPIEPELARTLKHAYLACVSYVDAQIGRMISALEEAGIRDDTIIIVWGDHGWHLGDMGVWGKATNYEIATRVPLLIWTPEMKTRGQTTNALVELVDIFPTLCELAKVPAPDHLEGHSFTPLLDDSNQPWKRAAFSQYPNPALREWAANPLSAEMRDTWFGPLIKEVEQKIIDQQGDRWNREFFEQHLMGYTMRTDRYRLVIWRDVRDATAEPVYLELFDHQTDPQETKNIAEQNPALVAKLKQQFDAGWRSAKPDKSKPRATPKIAVMETAFRKQGDASSILDARRAGYTAIQMHSGMPREMRQKTIAPDVGLAIGTDKKIVASWKQAAEKHDVQIISLCAGSLNKCQIWDRDRTVAMRIAKQTIDACHDLQVETMLFPFFGPSNFQTNGEALHGVADFMKELLPYAMEKNVVIGIEAPVTTDRVLELMGLLKFPTHLKIYYDTGNLFAKEDIYETIRTYAQQHFCEIHIKPFGHAVFGQDQIDISRLARALDDASYDKWLVYEAGRLGREPIANRQGIEKLVSQRQ